MRVKDEAKELQIINSAINLVSKFGLEGVKMTTVALNAGVATGTVYIYFKDRETLIKAVYMYIVKASASNFVNNYEPNNHIKGQIKSICKAYMENFIKNPGYSAFLEQFYRSSYFRSNPEFMELRNKAYQPVFAVIEEGKAQGIIKNIDTNLIAISVAGMMREVCKLSNFQDNRIENDLWEDVFSIIWDGLKS